MSFFLSRKIHWMKYQVKMFHLVSHIKQILKTLDTFCNFQRTVFSFGVSQHMHKITNLWQLIEPDWSSKLRDIIIEDKKKHPCRTSCVLSDAWFWDLIWGLELSSNASVRNYFFLPNYFTSEGAVSHNVLYYQQLSIAHYQVSFYSNNYFE